VFRERQNSVVQSQNAVTLAVLVLILYTEIQRFNQEAIRTLNPGLAGKNTVEYYWQYETFFLEEVNSNYVCSF